MDNKIEVIGIDHGWSGMKTVHEVFTSGCKEISTEPAFTENLLEFGGKYYKIGSRRLEVRDTKVTDENYYMLTLAAVAKELKIRGKKTAHVLLAVGLPLTRFGDEKKDFVSYLSKKKEVSFTFEKEKYHIFIENVCVYPQCYAAVIDRIDKFPEKQLVVDIGSWTVDIMPIINHLPDESVCVTQPHGIITCIQQINKECVRQLNAEVDEYDIQKVMVNGGGDLPEKYQEIIIKEIRDYCRQIYHNIRELGYNMDLTQIIFVGGGAGVMKRFGNLEQGNIQYIEDIKANAKGYEMLGNAYLAKAQRRKIG